MVTDTKEEYLDLKEENIIYPYQIESMKRLKKLTDMEKENKKLKDFFDSFETNYRKNEGMEHD